MPWYAWVLAIDLACSTLFKVATVGRPRNPITPMEAAVVVPVGTGYVLVVLHLGGLI